MSEHDEQAAVIAWAAYSTKRLPELAMLYAIPNGGARHKAIAAKLKAEGVKRGVPDLCLPVARAGWHGLYIELKAARGKPTDDQLSWIGGLIAHGYCALVCFGQVQARTVLEQYIKGDLKKPEERP